MKIILNINIKRPSNAVDLVPACDASIFEIEEYTYAFYGPNQTDPFLVIESEIFYLLMQRLAGKIVEFNVFRPLCLCCEETGLLVIRLTEADGCVYQFTEGNDLELCMNIETLYDEYNERN
ncbi:hypothetical protein DDZ13_09555 [Coraliomargarita sinensis]|uniref:Uncharacterized protein n=1 Tax=Coraliomargarita sinensis TaxID=2174842 RepID=A0A317ZES2_9BACT|nr:hypothetical protein [Coraliomargarita sinensis]PXA03876.1 hypothetical protein DDZ13_09555 [Coraliomargarita sinensis]